MFACLVTLQEGRRNDINSWWLLTHEHGLSKLSPPPGCAARTPVASQRLRTGGELFPGRVRGRREFRGRIRGGERVASVGLGRACRLQGHGPASRVSGIKS